MQTRRVSRIVDHEKSARCEAGTDIVGICAITGDAKRFAEKGKVDDPNNRSQVSDVGGANKWNGFATNKFRHHL